MIEITATIGNSSGLHLRPCTEILQTLQGFQGTVILSVRKQEIPLNSIFNLLSLGLKKGEKVVLKVDGPRGSEVARHMKTLFEKEYDLPLILSTSLTVDSSIA